MTQDGLALQAHGLCHATASLLIPVLLPEGRPDCSLGLKRLLSDYVENFALRYLFHAD